MWLICPYKNIYAAIFLKPSGLLLPRLQPFDKIANSIHLNFFMDVLFFGTAVALEWVKQRARQLKQTII
jgi:hypothetical protein